MLTYTIGSENPNIRLESCLKEHFKICERDHVKYRIVPLGGAPIQFCKVEFFTQSDSPADQAIAITYLTDVLCRILLHDLQDYELRKRINAGFAPLPHEEKEMLFKKARQLHNGENNLLWNSWFIITSNRLENYLIIHNEVILEGFIRFRMRDWMAALERNLAVSADEILMEKEYQEFIGLIREFVALSPAQVDEIHVLPEGKGYVLLDRDFQVLDNILLREMMPQSDPSLLSEEDTLISTLITLSPQRVILHGKFSPRLCQTLKEIFGANLRMSVEDKK